MSIGKLSDKLVSALERNKFIRRNHRNVRIGFIIKIDEEKWLTVDQDCFATIEQLPSNSLIRSRSIKLPRPIRTEEDLRALCHVCMLDYVEGEVE